MRLLYVVHQYYPAIGGAEKYTTELCEELAARDVEVVVYTSRSTDFHSWKNSLSKKEKVNGVTIHRFSSFKRRSTTWSLLSYGTSRYWKYRKRLFQTLVWFGNGPVMLKMFFSIVFNADRYDLVHICHLHYAHSKIAAIAARISKLPIVVTPFVHLEQPATYDFEYLDRILDSSDLIVSMTRREAEFLYKQNKNRHIVNTGVGIRLADYNPASMRSTRVSLEMPEDAFVVLFLGRKAKYKGVEQCLDAFVELRKQIPNTYFAIVGPETDWFKTIWAKYSNQDGLINKSYVDDEIRDQYLSACSVLCLPSSSESFGIVYLEAWLHKKPVIGLDSGSTVSLIDDEVDGLLATSQTSDDISKKFIDLATDQGKAKRLGENGYKKLLRNYTLDHVSDVMIANYQRLTRQAQLQRD